SSAALSRRSSPLPGAATSTGSSPCSTRTSSSASTRATAIRSRSRRSSAPKLSRARPTGGRAWHRSPGSPWSTAPPARSSAGPVITADDAGYDDARRVFFTGFDQHPAAIIRPADAADVARVVNLARESGSELAVRSGGHSRAGHGTTEGGIVLDLSPLNAVEI